MGSNKIKVRRIKNFTLDLPPVAEDGKICQKNPYVIHTTKPEHICTLEIEEIYVTQKEYDLLLKERHI